VLPPGRWPVTATESEALQAALGFERVAPARDAATAYRALLARWPANLVAAIGLGNALQAAGDLAGAAAALEAAAARHDSVMVWHNLARVRLAQGDRPAARTAAARALRLAERAQAAGAPEATWLERVRATLAEIG
jgi:predicted Zn-dependent protease